MPVEPSPFESLGVECAADLHRPEGAAGDVPCVVMAHGFSGTKEDALPAFAERFADAGLAVLRFDYRGFGDSAGEPRQVIGFRAQQDDYRAAIAHARALPGVDPGRIVVWGTSLSAGHALTVAAEDRRLAAVVAHVPFTSGLASALAVPPLTSVRLMGHAVQDLVGRKLGRPPHLVPATGRPGDVAAMTSPDAHDGLAAMVEPSSRWRNAVGAGVIPALSLQRPARFARRIEAPLLVVLAERDQVTPTGPTRRVASRAPRGELVTLPLGHFDPYVGEPFERSSGEQVAFLRRHGLTSS